MKIVVDAGPPDDRTTNPLDQLAQLREENARLRALAENRVLMLAEVERLQKENARLRAENERLSKLCCVCEGDCCNAAQKRLAEVKRLEGLILRAWDATRDDDQTELGREAKRIRGER